MYHIMSESEIADEVMKIKHKDGSEDSEEDETILPKMKLSVARSKNKLTSKVQTKLDSFFKAGLPKTTASISNSSITSRRVSKDN